MHAPMAVSPVIGCSFQQPRHVGLDSSTPIGVLRPLNFHRPATLSCALAARTRTRWIAMAVAHASHEAAVASGAPVEQKRSCRRSPPLTTTAIALHVSL